MTALFPEFDKTTSLQASSVSMSRGGSILFEGVNAHINAGDVLWIKGDNGIGKTTLLEAFAGLSRPETGTMTWSSNDIDVPANRIAAYQPHNSFAKPALTAKEDLRFWAQLYGTASKVNEALNSVGLKDRYSIPSRGLSAGQLKRLSLAKLILSQKPIWIMDEPDSAMDKSGTTLIESLVEQHLIRGGSVIIASHKPPQKLGANTRSLTLRGAA